jgi:CelD/BcsL family acetyltransferase involved in cellulose biosynthesis
LSAAFADPRFERFFTAVAGDASRPTGARVSVLTANGQIAAAEIAFACKGRLAVHIITYASKFAKLSAGSLLIEASLRCAKEEGLSTFDLLAPGDDYKLEWADGSVDVLDWAAPFSRRGEVFARLYLGWLRPRVKRVILATPPALRRPLCGFAGVTATVV